MFTRSTDTLTALCRDADEAEANGGQVTARLDALRTAWRTFLGHEPGGTAALVAAVRDGADPAHVGPAYIAALAGYAPHPETVAAIRQDVATALLPEVRAEFDKAAPANYETARAAYDKAAAALVKALEVVDPDADPASLMSAPEATRKAWGAVDVLTAALDEAAARLTSAARHVGIDTTDAGTVALHCQPHGREGDARRAVWAAWDEPAGRGGRWAALHRLGIKLEAPKAADHKPYRRPKPIETRYLKTDLGLRRVDYDPETNTPADAVPAGSTFGL